MNIKNTILLMVLVAISSIALTSYAFIATRDYQRELDGAYALYSQAHEANAFKYELLLKFDDYKTAADSLLNILEEHDEAYFLDVLMEKDIYWEMVEASNTIDSLYLSQL